MKRLGNAERRRVQLAVVLATLKTTQVLADASNRQAFEAGRTFKALAALLAISASAAMRRLTDRPAPLTGGSLGIHWSNHDAVGSVDTLININYKRIGAFPTSFPPIRTFLGAIADAGILYWHSWCKAPGRPNNFGELLLICFDFRIIEALFLHHRPTKVATWATICRRMQIIGRLCHRHHVDHTAIQHGKFRRLTGIKRVFVSEVSLLFPEDSQLVSQYFLPLDTRITLTQTPHKPVFVTPLNDLAPALGFASNPNHPEESIAVIETILRHKPEGFRLLIHPHPREGMAHYQAHFGQRGDVTITMTKYSGIQLLICRPSTICLEAAAEGINVLVYLSGKDRYEEYMRDLQCTADTGTITAAIHKLFLE